jgi:O-antigen/teichoic acid export membrane protein
MDASDEMELSKGLRVIAKSSLIVFIGVLLSKVFMYLYRVIIARYFGPEVYGLFSISLMILTIFVVTSLLGLSEGLLRFIPIYRGKKEKNKISGLFKIVFSITLLSSLFFSFMLYFSSSWISNTIFHNPDLITYLKISAFIIPFLALSNICLSAIRAFEKISAYSFILNIFQNILKLISIIILILLGLKSSSIMLSYMLGTVSMFIFAYLFCKHKIPELFIGKKILNSEKKKMISSVFAYSLPLMFSGVIAIIYYWIDSFVIGAVRFNGILEVGIYNAAVPIALLLSIIPELFMQMFYPLITNKYAKGNNKVIKELSKQVAKWIFIITLPIFIIIFLFPGAVINIFFGSKFLSAELVLKILALGSFISIFTGFLTTLLSMAGKSKTIFINLITTSVVNLFLNIMLVPKYGIIGAAISTAISWTLLTIILFVQVRLVLGFIPIRKKMLNIFLVSLIPTAILILTRSFVSINFLSLLILGFMFILAYILSIFLIRGFDRNDLEVIRSMKGRLPRLKK